MHIPRFILIGTALVLVGCGVVPPTVRHYEKEGMFVPVAETSSSSIAPTVLKETTELIPDEKGLVVDDHVQFSVGDTHVRVRKETSDASLEIEELISNEANRCGEVFSALEIGALREAYAGKDMIFYTIYDPEILASPRALYYVKLLPNSMSYKDLNSVNQDFEMCAAGSLSVITMSQKWVIFGGFACGGGDVCDHVQEVVPQSIKLR